MSNLDQYLDAAERENTRRSYASAIRHFEEEWKGLLPSTVDAIACYLADHAATLAINTLRQRLAALFRWHTDHGFPDPTKSPLVRRATSVKAAWVAWSDSSRNRGAWSLAQSASASLPRFSSSRTLRMQTAVDLSSQVITNRAE